MNGDMDFMVLNGKLKDIQGSNTRQENSLSAIDEKMTDVSNKMTDVGNKMDNLSVDVDLSPVNSTIETSYFKPLDLLLSARVMLIGAPTTTFTLTNTDTNEQFSYTIKDSDAAYDDINFKKIKIIPVNVGMYKVDIEYKEIKTTVDFNAETLGSTYKIMYELLLKLEEVNTSKSVTIPEKFDFVYIDAVGAGGGGGGGYYTSNSSNRRAGGGGGGGGECAVNFLIDLRNHSKTLNITIGTGGQGGAEANNGTQGGATIIDTILTLRGGDFGTGAGMETLGLGGAQVASGGRGGDYNNNGATAGQKSKFEQPGGDAGTGLYAGGGGGGGFKPGGKGAAYTGDMVGAEPGGIGAGGGGGSGASKSGFQQGKNGGNGIVVLYAGVIVDE